MMNSKKGFLPQVVGLEVHYFLIGLVAGIILFIILLMLGKAGTIPVNFCRLLCG